MLDLVHPKSQNTTMKNILNPQHDILKSQVYLDIDKVTKLSDKVAIATYLKKV